MPLAIAPSQNSSFPGIDCGQYLEYYFFSVTATGNYPAGGDSLNFTGTSPLLVSTLPPVPGSVNIVSQSAASGHSGYQYYYRPGAPATMANGKMQVLTTGSGSGQPMVELSAGAYPAAITGDTIVGTAAFPKA